MMVFIRWAIVNTVLSLNWVLRVDWIWRSVSKSTAAVASSRMRILAFWRSALARQTSCFWPVLQVRRGMVNWVFSGSEYVINLKIVMKTWLFPFPERVIEAGGTADNSMKQPKEMKGVYYYSPRRSALGTGFQCFKYFTNTSHHND